MKPLLASDIAKCIDHTMLKPVATASDIAALCKEAIELKCHAVCVYAGWLDLVREQLGKSGVTICAVVGFPHGATATESKVEEARICLNQGAQEIDMVLNIGRLKSRDLAFVRRDIEAVQKAVREHNAILKVIIETALLETEEKKIASNLIVDAGAAFVKTCTGFSGGEATVEDVQLIKNEIGNRALIKASGGIKDRAKAESLLAAGASRLGTSSTRAILSNETGTGNY